MSECHNILTFFLCFGFGTKYDSSSESRTGINDD
jgi:hypothetical protein